MQHDWPIIEVTRAWAAPALVLAMIVLTLAACSSSTLVYDDAVAHRSPLSVPPDMVDVPADNIPTVVATGPSIIGYASWYRRGPYLERTCTGDQLSDSKVSAASPTLPMGTVVRVKLVHDDRSIIVRVDDCMPRGHRVIDLSVEAARQLGLLRRGVALVSVTPVSVP